MKPFEIILAEDHVMFRHLMKKSIENLPGMHVLGEASSGLELLQLLKLSKPDMVILDISMPDIQGIEAAKEIKKLSPGIKILIVTMHKSKECLRRALAAGVDGYLLKENAFEDLLTAIQEVRRGKSYLSPLVSNQVKEIILGDASLPEPGEPLTTREIVILKLFAEGRSTREIAKLLFISVATVNRHRFNIRRKLNIKSNAFLVRYAIEKGYTGAGINN